MDTVRGVLLPDDPGPPPSLTSSPRLEEVDPRDVIAGALEHAEQYGLLDRSTADRARSLAQAHDDEGLLGLLASRGLARLVSVVCRGCGVVLLPPFWQGEAVVRCGDCGRRFAVWVRGLVWEMRDHAPSRGSDMLDWRVGDEGIGAVLLSDARLSRHRTGQPYQALFFFDAEGQPTRLVRDGAGRVLGYDYGDDGDAIVDEATFVPLPADVATAAEAWFSSSASAASEVRSADESAPMEIPSPEEMQAQFLRSGAVAARCIGMTEDAAVDAIVAAGCVVRVTRRDREAWPLTLDASPWRVNIAIEGGRVVEAQAG